MFISYYLDKATNTYHYVETMHLKFYNLNLAALYMCLKINLCCKLLKQKK